MLARTACVKISVVKRGQMAKRIGSRDPLDQVPPAAKPLPIIWFLPVRDRDYSASHLQTNSRQTRSTNALLSLHGQLLDTLNAARQSSRVHPRAARGPVSVLRFGVIGRNCMPDLIRAGSLGRGSIVHRFKRSRSSCSALHPSPHF